MLGGMKLARYLLYPVVMTAGLLLAWAQLYPWGWPLWSILLPVSAGFAICWCGERWLPYRRSWQAAQDDVGTDLTYIGVNLALRELGGLALKAGLLLVAAAAGASQVALGLWPDAWHPLAQMLLAILVLDFFEYGFHRASHRVGWLWRFHAIHHSPGRLYFFNASRFHFVDWLVLIAIEVAVLLLLGAEARVVALALVFVQLHGLFQHANIDLRLGPLNWLVSGPELHRWHHSRVIAESDRNFGNNTILWDLLFGTYYLPRDRQVGVLGLLNPDYPRGFIQQSLAPFGPRRDKPADYHQRPEHYAALVAEENRLLTERGG